MKRHSNIEIALIVVAIVYNLAITFYTMLWLFTSKMDWLKSWLFGAEYSNEKNIQAVLFSFFISGMLGGASYCLRGVYHRLSDAYTPKVQTNFEVNPIEVLNIKVWLFWYLYRPIQSGILAIVIICLFNQGLLNLNNLDNSRLGSIYFQIAIGYLIGFGTHEVINKIEELIKVLFAKSKSESKTANSASLEKINENQQNS